MYINNHLGFIFLGDMGGTWGAEGLGDKETGCRYQQGLGDKETGCRYQQVHKQPFRVYLFRGHGGDLGLGRTCGQGDRV